MYPDDPGFPNYHKKTDEEYYDLGFYSSPYALKIKRRFSPTITTTSTKKAVKKRESEVECPTPE